jgi:hypothetical protein
MALRVLSGMLFINDGPKNGAATITFNPLRLAAAPGSVSLRKAKVVGADGTFTRAPASIVAARQFAILDVSPDSDYKLRISDTVTTTAIRITWAGSGPIFHEEIPFMVVGDVPAPRPRRPRGRPGRRSQAKAARRRKARR